MFTPTRPVLALALALTVVSAVMAGACVSNTTLVIQPEELPSAIVGQPYTVDFVVEGGGSVGDIEFEGDLPAGLTFDRQDGSSRATLSGTPTEAGTFQFTVSAWLFPTMTTSGSGDREYALLVNP